MSTLKQALLSNSRTPKHVTPDSSLRDASKLLAAERVGALPVREDGELMGIFTERDLVVRVAMGINLDTTSVGDVMTRNVIVADSSATIEHAMTLMNRHNIRHLPTMHDGALVGIVSMRDLVELAYSEDEQRIADLNAYIYGP